MTDLALAPRTVAIERRPLRTRRVWSAMPAATRVQWILRRKEKMKGKTWLTAAALALLPWPALGAADGGRGPAADHASQVERPCTAAERSRTLALDQRRVLARVGPLTTLRGPLDQAALAARGWSVPPHQYTSIGGMAVAFARTDFLTAPVEPGNPFLLLYAPSPDTRNVADPRGADFPYRLRGWAYVAPYDFYQHPTGLGLCVPRADWFVHERGVHTFDDGGFQAVPPEEEVHGTAPGSDPPPPPSPTRPGFPHPRFWDVHIWLDGDHVPTVSMLNPGEPIPGIDPHVGEWFFYPPPAANQQHEDD